MVRKIIYRRLRVGQTAVLNRAASGPVSNETLDNPGWSDVADVGRVQAPAPVSEERNMDDWVRCDVKDGRFHGYGGPGNLQEILEILRAWIHTSHG